MAVQDSDQFQDIDAMFTSIRFEARMENHTSHTAVMDPSKIAIVEFGEKSLVLEVPARSVNTEHQITLTIERVGVAPGEEFSFAATGKIESVEKVDAERIRVVFNLLQFDAGSWKQYQDLYAARQEEITEFLFSVNR